jgi:hypothetical protein
MARPVNIFALALEPHPQRVLTPMFARAFFALGRAWPQALFLAACIATVASAQSPTFTRVGAIAGPAEAMRAQGSHLYVAAGRTLTIYDTSDPASPKRMGAYTFPEEVWSFRVAEPYVYVGVNFFGLGILDVSNPAAPALRGSFKTPGQAKIGAVFGSKAAVIDHMEGVVFVDVTTPGKPSAAGTFFVDGYARDIVASGPFAYAVDSPTGLYVFDLSKSNATEPIATLQSGTAVRNVEASDTLVLLLGGGLLQPYDVSHPAAPVRIEPFKTPGGAQRAALDGRIAYVADGRQGLQVVDFSAPAAPRITGTYKTATPARDVAVSGGVVFLAVGGPQEPQEIVILRRTP